MTNTVSKIISDEDLSAIIQIESGGRPNAKATSSATGLGQFISATWLTELKRYRPDLFNGAPYDDELALRKQPHLAVEILARFTEENALALGQGWSRGDLYLAHFLGVGTAKKFLRAAPGTSAEALAGPDAVHANRSIMAGKTAGAVRAWAAKRMKESDGRGWVAKWYGGQTKAQKEAPTVVLAPIVPTPQAAPVIPTPVAPDATPLSEWMRPDKGPEPTKPALEAAEEPEEAEEADTPALVPAAPAILVDAGPMSGAVHPITKALQTELNSMGYFVGEEDGRWGGKTKGGIAGFKNDRHLAGEGLIDAELLNQVARAKAEGFTRPIAEARKNATAETLAPKLKEVAASKMGERVGFWATIGMTLSSIITGAGAFAGDAIEWISKVKDVVGDLPLSVYVAGMFGIALVMYFVTRKAGEAKDAATEAYQKGARV